MTATLMRVQPRLMVCGHIHPAYGRYRLGAREIINASLVDGRYQPINAPCRSSYDGGRLALGASLGSSAFP
jgi:hypothetical protein